MDQDTRWRQRFDNFVKAFEGLNEAVELSMTRPLSKLEKQGLIQAFEYTHELAWNTLKDYLRDKGITGLIGSKDSVRAAYQNDLITEGEVWMQMIRARNLTVHTYDEATAEHVVRSIIDSFHPAFSIFHNRFKVLSERDEDA